MAEKIRWGLLGAGNIINRWIKGARQFDDMEIVAVASRTRQSAEKIAKTHDIKVVMTYEEMVTSEDIDVVYIAVPHVAHKELAMLAMQHGKGVLVEKPAAVNAAELQQMIDCAIENKVFLMEAVWTRFFPLVQTIHGLMNEEGIGEVRAINCAFSSRISAEYRNHRTLNPDLAGGGLLDIGVYNLHLCDMIYDKNPVSLIGLATIDSDKYHIQVDEQAMYLAQYDKGELASMASGVRTKMVDTAYIYGTNGYIELPEFWRPKKMRVNINGETKEYSEAVPQHRNEYVDEGFQYEVAHVNECLRMGLIESPIMTWDKSLRILKQCDELRRQWGLSYPFERG